MSTPLYDNLRANIRRLMEEYNWNQSDLAGAMGCTQGFVSHVLTGRLKHPSLEVIQNFADALQVDPISLLEHGSRKK